MNVLKRDLIEGEQIVVIDGSAWLFTETSRSKSRHSAAGTVHGTGYKVGKRGREIGDLYRIHQKTDSQGTALPWVRLNKVFNRVR